MIASSSYLLDTNAISETRLKVRDTEFDAFFSTLQPSMLYVSVLTLGELRKGVANRRRKDTTGAIALERWVNRVEEEFAERTLQVDRAIAKLWGELSAGRTRPAIDTLLAATAIHHDLTVITRNVTDFSDLPVRWVSPWTLQ